jgi:hypothetical protein
MYVDFIHNGCKLDFTQEDIINGGLQKKMMLLIMPVKRGDKDNDKEIKVIEIEQPKQVVFAKKAMDLILKDEKWRDNMEPAENCWKNKSTLIECDANC